MARTVVMTGATGGIGAAAVKKLAKMGMNVVMVTHNQQAGDELSAACAEYPGEVVAMSNDGGDAAVFPDVYERFGSVDVVIPNHGAPDFEETLETIEDEKFEWKFHHQVINTFDMIKAAVPYMKKGGFGRIILMSSVGAYSGDNSYAFTTSVVNGAVTSMMKQLSGMFAADGITVNAIAKGHMEPDHPGHGAEADVTKIPMGRVATAEDFANAVAFLASEESGYVTGQTIALGGGEYKA